MFQFIMVLRAVACLLITNSHQEYIYPIRILASGGLLGDAIFFAVSGFCLYSLKEQTFPKWYFRRLRRVYPPVWLTAGLFLITGLYGRQVSAHRVFELMVYPTHYHFVASILVVYIFFFCLMKLMNYDAQRRETVLTYAAVGLAILYFAIFYTVFDRTSYHIDNVNDHFIWMLYLASMIVGIYFRIHVDEYLGKNRVMPWVGTLVLALLYISTKVMASRGVIPFSFQWVNQITLLLLLVFVFRCFIGLETLFKNAPPAIIAPVRGISEMAFELYLTQVVIIPVFAPVADTFPRNFVIVISITFLCAWLVHHTTNIILQLCSMVHKKGAEKA